MDVKVVQLVEAWTVNHVVGSSSPRCAKLAKSFQQAFNPKFVGLSDQSLVYHNNIAGTLKIHLYPLHISQVLRLPSLFVVFAVHFAPYLTSLSNMMLI